MRSAVGRLLAATLVVVLSGLAVGSAGSVAQAAADDAFTVTLADGSPAVVAGSGTTPLAAASPGRFTLPTAQASSPVRFSFVANCVLEDEACQDASATLELDELRLAGLVVPAAPVAGGVGYTVAYLDEHGAELGDPSADLGAVRAVRLGFVSYGADAAPVPLAGGSILEVALDATLLAPDGGGEQVGSVTVLPSVDGEAQTSSTVEVVTTVVPVLATTTTKTWTPADPYLSGAADTARTATVTFTSTGDTATSLVVEAPADPTAVPAGADAFNLLRVTGLSLPVWPAGATQLTITTWHDGVSGPSTTAADLGAAQAWLAALPAAELDRLTGVRLAFTGTFARGATGTLEVATAQLAGGAATPGAVTGRHGAVAYDESGAVPTASASSDFHTVRVTNSADTTASSTVAGAQPATSAASAELRIWDPEPYAGATKRFVRPGTATDTADVYPGGYAAVQLTGTSWTRRAVESLVLSDQPGTSDGAVAAAVQGVRAGGADARMFAADGLVMAGFGAGVAAGAGDGTGLVWPEGADALTLVVRTGGGTGTWTGAPGDALPTSLAAFTGLTGDPAWSDVTGLEARFTGEIAMGASGTVPYLVTTGATAVPGTTVDNLVLARTTVGGLTSDPTPRTPGSGNKPVVADSLTIAEPYAAATLTKTIPEPFVDVRGGDVTAVLRGAAAAGTDLPTTLVLEDSRGVGSSGAWWARFAPTDVEVTAEGAGRPRSRDPAVPQAQGEHLAVVGGLAGEPQRRHVRGRPGTPEPAEARLRTADQRLAERHEGRRSLAAVPVRQPRLAPAVPAGERQQPGGAQAVRVEVVLHLRAGHGPLAEPGRQHVAAEPRVVPAGQRRGPERLVERHGGEHAGGGAHVRADELAPRHRRLGDVGVEVRRDVGGQPGGAQGRRQGDRPGHQVRLAREEGSAEGAHPVRRHAHVVVGEQHGPPGGRPGAGVPGPAQPRLGDGDDPDPGVPRRGVVEHRPGAVGGGAVHEHQLARHAVRRGVVERGADGRDRRADAAGAVAGADDDGHGGPRVGPGPLGRGVALLGCGHGGRPPVALRPSARASATLRPCG